ncbi:hypothetical protein NIES2098_02610 [Calothrix sp. NIES-2098]|nr:hypothetical protein NIES2098_02610 [Calothrix sp. NIES-2098]
MGSITATVSAIALGYLGVQYLNQTAMFTVAGAMLGLGATTQLTQLKSKSHVPSSEQSLPPSVPVIAVSEEPPQPVKSISQPVEQKIERQTEVIESDSSKELRAESDFSKELRAEIDPIIERFMTVGLEDF